MVNKKELLNEVGYKEEVKKPTEENNKTQTAKYNKSIDENSLLRGFLDGE